MNHFLSRRKMTQFLSQSAALMAVSMLPASAAVRGDEVRYVGGTLPIQQDTEGKLELTDGDLMKWFHKKDQFEVPYESITSIEYGQKAGRRLGVAVMVSPVFLLSKKRKHFLSLGYKDAAGKNQAVVLELPKGLPRMVISVLEARSGMKCEYESEEAKKHVNG